MIDLQGRQECGAEEESEVYWVSFAQQGSAARTGDSEGLLRDKVTAHSDLHCSLHNVAEELCQ